MKRAVPLLLAATAFAAPVRAQEATDAATDAASTQAPYAPKNTGALFLGAEFLGAIVVFAACSTATGDPATSCGWCATNAVDRSMRDLR